MAFLLKAQARLTTPRPAEGGVTANLTDMLTSDAQSIDKEMKSLEALALSQSPKHIEEAINLVLRWVAILTDNKPVCFYRYEPAQGGSVGMHNHMAFIFWLNKYHQNKIYDHLLVHDPLMASVFRAQLLNIAAREHYFHKTDEWGSARLLLR